MAIKEFTISIDDSIYSNSESILEDMGLDIETAIKIFLKKIIKEKRMPFELIANQQPLEFPVLPTQSPSIANPPELLNRDVLIQRRSKRETNKITSDMCLILWNEFKRCLSFNDRNLQQAAQKISTETGMNKGSAFIYFNILSNLVDGMQNTRTLKFEDLEFFIDKIREELPENILLSVIKSLETSIPYWDEKVPGSFSDKVRSLVEKLKVYLKKHGK